MYKVYKCNIWTGYKNNQWFDVKTGVKQRSVLSPLLFIAFLDIVIKRVKNKMGDLKGDIMAYMGDLACWSEKENKLIEILHCFQPVPERGGVTHEH